MTQNRKNILLIVGTVFPRIWREFGRFKKLYKKRYRLAIMYDKSKLSKDVHTRIQGIFDIEMPVSYESEKSIWEQLAPYRNEIRAVTCRYEGAIPRLAKVIPYLPYIPTPTSESLYWSVNKIAMRRRLRQYNPKIAPQYAVVTDTKKNSIKKIEDKVKFPVVIKPTGLAQSLLVTICYHSDELEKGLKATLRKIKRIYKEANRSTTPEVLVEEFMDGDIYSIDAVVNARGKVSFYPMVAVKTGRAIGFDDFFGYQQLTPTGLNTANVLEARGVAEQAIYALGLRNSTAHVELMKTEGGWKVIELGPRLGGFRDALYRLSYGIDATANDFFIRMGKPVYIPQKRKGYAAAMKFFAKKEGVITNLTGIKKSQELESFHEINVHAKVGDKAIFAKNGGISLFNIIMFNKDRSKLLADIRRLEQMVKIETKKKSF
jgi:biotin carboxylase